MALFGVLFPSAKQCAILILVGLVGKVTSQLSTSHLQVFRSNGVNISDLSSDPTNYWLFEHHGVPSHDYGPFPNPDNPGTVSEQEHMFVIPKSPTPAATPGCLTLGTIAVAVNGVPLYNPYSGFGYNAVEGENREIFDNCTGHPQQQGVYHYHTIPECLYTGAPDQLIGVALDGYPIYGPLDGSTGRNISSYELDACNGRMVNGKYQYRLTFDYPYIMGCYYGEVYTGSAAGRKKRQAPGGGPPPNGGQPPSNGGDSGGSFRPDTCLYVTFCENPANGCPCSAYTWIEGADRTNTDVCDSEPSAAGQLLGNISVAMAIAILSLLK